MTKKCLNYDLEKEGQGQEVEEWHLCYSTGNVRFHIPSNFEYNTHFFTENINES